MDFNYNDNNPKIAQSKRSSGSEFVLLVGVVVLEFRIIVMIGDG